MSRSEKMIRSAIDEMESKVLTILRCRKTIEEAERLMSVLTDFGASEKSISVVNTEPPAVVIWYYHEAKQLLRDIDAAALLISHVKPYGHTSQVISLTGWNVVLEVESAALESLGFDYRNFAKAE